MDDLADYLLSHTIIHVSNACGAHYTSPIQVYTPQHHPYRDHQPYASARTTSSITTTSPLPSHADSSSSLRSISSLKAHNGHAVVYDRDIINTWRLPSPKAAEEVCYWEKAFEAALGTETVEMAVEVFLERKLQDCEDVDVKGVDASRLLFYFGLFMDNVGPQPVTITMSTVVQDLVACYEGLMVGGQIAPFSWHGCLGEKLRAFLMTRDCFVHHPGREPHVEATFRIENCREGTLVVEVCYTRVLPRLHLIELCNGVSEDGRLVIKPDTTSIWPDHAGVPVDATYFIGPARNWLRWDPDCEHFEGVVPPRVATRAAGEQQDTYTIPLELTATLVGDLGAGIKFERVIRVALPMTVRKGPDLVSSAMDTVRNDGDERTVSQIEPMVSSNGKGCDPLMKLSLGKAWSPFQPGGCAIETPAIKHEIAVKDDDKDNQEPTQIEAMSDFEYWG